MARLTEPQKRFLVRRIACFVPVKQIRAEFKEEFKLALTDQQVSDYNPETAHGQASLSKDLKNLFEEERARYISDEESVPIAHRAYRLRRKQAVLDRIDEYHRLLPEKAVGLHADLDKLEKAILIQAAQERGGMLERPKQGDGGTQQGALDQLRAFLTAPTPENG